MFVLCLSYVWYGDAMERTRFSSLTRYMKKDPEHRPGSFHFMIQFVLPTYPEYKQRQEVPQ